MEYLPDLRPIGENFPLDRTSIEAVVQEFDFILGHHYEFCYGKGHTPTAHDQFFYAHAVDDVIEYLEGDKPCGR